MISFGPRTIRAKLTLVTMLVMGGLLGFFGLGVYFLAKDAVIRSIDDDLGHRGQMVSHPPPGMPNFPEGDHRHEHGPDGHGPDGPFGPEQHDHGGGANSDMHKSDATNTMPGIPPRRYFLDSKTKGVAPYNPTAFAIVAKQKKPIYSTVQVDDRPYRFLTVPMLRDGKLIGITEVSSPLSDAYQTLSDLKRVLLTIVIPAGVVLSGLAGLWLMGLMTRPLRLITQNAEAIGAHNAAERLPVVGKDEFASVATTLNGMLDRLEEGLRFEQTTNKRLEQTVIQQRRFTEDASHELKTPLAVIKANTGLMLHFGGNAEEMHESLVGIEGAANRMNLLVSDLLTLARAEAGQLNPRFESVDFATVIREAVNQLGATHDRVSICAPREQLIVEAAPDDLARVFVNLVDNAVRHSGSDCPVEVVIRGEAGTAVAEVRDRGTGVAAEHLDHLFDRFYRVDKSRSSESGGTGLGLAICKGVVEAHHGTISVASVVGEGTVFTVCIPLA